MYHAEIKELLEDNVLRYNRTDFIADDPIAVPHGFSGKEDIEISGLLTATLAWGQRVTILRNARLMMEMMEGRPHDFLQHHVESDLKPITRFVHRTFNGDDLLFFITALAGIYRSGGLEQVFTRGFVRTGTAFGAIEAYREAMLDHIHQRRSEKHIGNPSAGSACKRLNMYLRWMVRRDRAGVDFGIWKGISPSMLSIPLDVHSGRIARTLGLLTRSTDDRRAVEELDGALRTMDPIDPVKYDFALFSLGTVGWRFK